MRPQPPPPPVLCRRGGERGRARPPSPPRHRLPQLPRPVPREPVAGAAPAAPPALASRQTRAARPLSPRPPGGLRSSLSDRLCLRLPRHPPCAIPSPPPAELRPPRCRVGAARAVPLAGHKAATAEHQPGPPTSSCPPPRATSRLCDCPPPPADKERGSLEPPALRAAGGRGALSVTGP